MFQDVVGVAGKKSGRSSWACARRPPSSCRSTWIAFFPMMTSTALAPPPDGSGSPRRPSTVRGRRAGRPVPRVPAADSARLRAESGPGFHWTYSSRGGIVSLLRVTCGGSKYSERAEPAMASPSNRAAAGPPAARNPRSPKSLKGPGRTAMRWQRRASNVSVRDRTVENEERATHSLRGASPGNLTSIRGSISARIPPLPGSLYWISPNLRPEGGIRTTGRLLVGRWRSPLGKFFFA